MNVKIDFVPFRNILDPYSSRPLASCISLAYFSSHMIPFPLVFPVFQESCCSIISGEELNYLFIFLNIPFLSFKISPACFMISLEYSIVYLQRNPSPSKARDKPIGICFVTWGDFFQYCFLSSFSHWVRRKKVLFFVSVQTVLQRNLPIFIISLKWNIHLSYIYLSSS